MNSVPSRRTAEAAAPVAIFLPSLRGGGAERSMVTLAAGLSGLGNTVVLVLGRAEGPFLDEVPTDVEVVDLNAGRVATALTPLTRFLRERKPRALLSTPGYANIIAVWARELATSRCRLVLREANTLSQTAAHSRRLTDRWMPLLARWFYPLADAVIAVSEGVATDLRETARLAHVLAIPNPAVGPETKRLAEVDPGHSWLDDGVVPVILAVGSLTPQKDYPTLLRAFRRLAHDRPARLLVLGEGPERLRLERLREDLDLGRDVEFVGFVGNPFGYMARADVLALSSRWEGWPNVCAQALALGTPVVATDCPHGPAEILDGGRFGELVPVGDDEAFATGLVRALDCPPERNALVERGSEFNLDRSARAYAEVLGLDVS